MVSGAGMEGLEKKNLLIPPRIEPWFLGCPAQCFVAVPIMIPDCSYTVEQFYKLLLLRVSQ